MVDELVGDDLLRYGLQPERRAHEEPLVRRDHGDDPFELLFEGRRLAKLRWQGWCNRVGRELGRYRLLYLVLNFYLRARIVGGESEALAACLALVVTLGIAGQRR